MRQLHISFRWPLVSLVLFSLLIVLAGCAAKENKIIAVVVPDPLFMDLSFGMPETFEIMTWNLQTFPGDNPTDRVHYAATALESLQVDIIGLQEITSGYSFNQVVDSLPDYDGYRADDWMALAFIWNTSTITVDSIFEIYVDESYAFPRRPLVMACAWNGIPLLVINNHLKAFSGVTNEAKRQAANILLEKFISETHPDDRVIMLGDFNDLLIDTGTNVFRVFLDLPASYLFTDLEIAGDAALGWSWRLSSHLDHIMITDELFSAFGAAASEIRTLRLDRYLKGGYNEYDNNLSDHLPVVLRLDMATTIQ